jgi:SAM-dependent methyltransferase
VPTITEVNCELRRQRIFKQVDKDFFIDPRSIAIHELGPQGSKIKERQQNDVFPSEEEAEEAWTNGKARIEDLKNGIIRLIIKIKGFDHPVMTNEEIEWVRDTAEMIARFIRDRKDGKVFIAGLGLGLLNEELEKLGIKDIVIAEINKSVIDLVGKPLMNKNDKLDIRQGDWKKRLNDAIANGELFDVISIDAFPNTADEVNRDASTLEVLELAFKALKPGGKLTFYPDSRYLPLRILNALDKIGIPKSAIHYDVSKFKTSEFTKRYHYGGEEYVNNYMAVPEIIKPMIDNNADDSFEKIKGLSEQYFESLSSQMEEMIQRHKNITNQPEEEPLVKKAA